MDKQDLAIIWLSAQVFFFSVGLNKIMYDLGFERGKVAALTTFTNDPAGECLVPQGCDSNHNPKPMRKHK